MPRLFIAIDPPPAIKARLAALGGGVPGARWTAAEQIHLTLRFIGEVEGGLFADIAEGLAEVRAAPFALAIDGVGHFPPRGAPKLLWAGVADPAGALTRLRGRVEARLRALGLEADGRKFTAHLTLARLKGAPIGRVRDFLAHRADLASEPFTIADFHLYSSHLGAGGAIHRIEASYPLTGGE